MRHFSAPGLLSEQYTEAEEDLHCQWWNSVYGETGTPEPAWELRGGGNHSGD